MIDPRFVRPAEVEYLLGDSSKAEARRGWKPEVNFHQLIQMMEYTDLEWIEKET